MYISTFVIAAQFLNLSNGVEILDWQLKEWRLQKISSKSCSVLDIESTFRNAKML